MERMFPVWAMEKRLTKVNVRDKRYLDILLGVLMVVMGGKYTDVRDNNWVYLVKFCVSKLSSGFSIL
jgi:hypothetical protein